MNHPQQSTTSKTPSNYLQIPTTTHNDPQDWKAPKKSEKSPQQSKTILESPQRPKTLNNQEIINNDLQQSAAM